MCSPAAIELAKVRAAKAPKVEPDDLDLPCKTCGERGCEGWPSCHVDGDPHGPDEDMERWGFVLRRDTTHYGERVSVTTERWDMAEDE